MQRSIIAIAFLFASNFSFAAGVSCEAVSAKAESQGGALFPRLGYKVVGKGRLYFYSAPDAACRTATFVIPKDHLIAYTEFGGWLSVMYTHPKTGEPSDGWVKADRLKVTGTMSPTQ